MLSVHWSTIRLFLHVLAATVWVGGQLTLAGLVPGLRAISPDAPRTVARRFNRVACKTVKLTTWSILTPRPSVFHPAPQAPAALQAP